MLWNLIFDFYVKYIFGGLDIGLYEYDCFYTEEINSLTDLVIKMNGQDVYFYWGNYFSFFATMITMIIILVVIGHFIKKLFNVFGRII